MKEGDDAVPKGGESLATLRRCLPGCRNCPLWKNATQAVFGEGSRRASIMIVGEQPGSQEDLAGRPFVGPAGKLLDRALADAGVDRKQVWITNAVKHFKWEARGKVRLHKRPTAGEIEACRPWLSGELSALAPSVLILLGATAVRSLLGPRVKVMKHRGIYVADHLAPQVIVTIHPSLLLRRASRGSGEEHEWDYARFVADLALAVPRKAPH
jgi:uracil-DNA glycosylase family protein